MIFVPTESIAPERCPRFPRLEARREVHLKTHPEPLAKKRGARGEGTPQMTIRSQSTTARDEFHGLCFFSRVKNIP